MLQLNNLDKISSNHVLPINQGAQEIRKLYKKKLLKKFIPTNFLLKIVFVLFTGQISLTSVTPGQLRRRVHKRIFKPLLIKQNSNITNEVS